MRRGASKVGLLDHMGGGNLGDDSTQTAVIGAIRSRWPDAVIHGFSMNPADTQARHGIQCHPIRRQSWDNPDRDPTEASAVNRGAARPAERYLLVRRLARFFAFAVAKPISAVGELVFLARSFRIVRALDVFVVSGGGQLLDSWGGTWNYPYTIFKWVALARLSGTRCYFVNVGAGPLHHSLSRYLIRQALNMADYISFRDQDSEALVRRIGFKGEASVFPDSAYGLAVPVYSVEPRRDETRNAETVGLSPMAYRDPGRYWIQDQPAYDAFLRKIVEFATPLSQRHFLALFSTDIWFDAQTLERVETALSGTPDVDVTHLLAREPITNIATLFSHMASMDYIVTCRFHGVVFAHLMNIPVIALSHHPKVTTLMSDLGLSEFCIDIDTFEPEQLTSAFDRLMAEKASIKARMAKRLTAWRHASHVQFDRLFAPEAH